MKKIIELLCVVIGIASFIFSTNERAAAQYTESNECSKQMAEETAQYIRNSKISLKGLRSEFYSNKNEQIYVLSSEEKVNLNAAKPGKRVVAVINRKLGGKLNDGTFRPDGFYVVESEFQRNSVVYSLKKDSKIIKTIKVALFKPEPDGTVPTDPFCDKIKKEAAIRSAQMQKLANDTCTITGTCIEICQSSQVIGYSMVIFKPQSVGCFTLTNYSDELFLRVEAVLIRDAELFTYVVKNSVKR